MQSELMINMSALNDLNTHFIPHLLITYYSWFRILVTIHIQG